MIPETLPTDGFTPLRTVVGRYVISTIFSPSRAHADWHTRWDTAVIIDGRRVDDDESWTLTPEETWTLRAKLIAECAIAELRRLAEEVTAVAAAAGLGSVDVASTHVHYTLGGVGRHPRVLLHGPEGVAAVRATGHAEDGRWNHGQRDVRLATEGVETYAIEKAEDLAPLLAASLERA